MIQLEKDQMKLAQPFFKNSKDTLILSVLQGRGGYLWLDQLDHPTAAKVLQSDFIFFAGIPNRTMVESTLCLTKGEEYLMVPENQAWCDLIEDVYPDSHAFNRYAIRKDGPFDRDRLEIYSNTLPQGCQLQAVNETIYKTLKTASWSWDICGNFDTYEDFQRDGLGYVVVLNGEPIAGAGSYSLFDGGIEIEIDTHRDHRRKGLALACGARLILECIDKNLRPGWDAANLASVALAEKLGYTLDHAYVTYRVSV